MSDKTEVYEYPVQYKVIATIAPLLFILAAVGVSLTAWLNLKAANWITEAGQLVNPIVFLMTVLATVCLATFFGVCIHITYPTIIKSKDGFQIVTRIYTSRWFAWGEITKAGLPPSQLVTQIYSIGVPGLHPVFWVIGLSRGLFAPAFLIHPRMINGAKLMRTIIQKRPELFED